MSATAKQAARAGERRENTTAKECPENKTHAQSTLVERHVMRLLTSERRELDGGRQEACRIAVSTGGPAGAGNHLTGAGQANGKVTMNRGLYEGNQTGPNNTTSSGLSVIVQ